VRGPSPVEPLRRSSLSRPRGPVRHRHWVSTRPRPGARPARPPKRAVGRTFVLPPPAPFRWSSRREEPAARRDPPRWSGGVESEGRVLHFEHMLSRKRRGAWRGPRWSRWPTRPAWPACRRRRWPGSSREQAAGGLRIARLLAQKYPATREAFAAGDLRVEQVQVILNAAEQAPAPPTPQRRPTPRPGPAPPHLRRRRLHPPLRLVRDPPPPAQLEQRRPHRPRQRATPVRTPPPTNPRPTLPTQSPTRRRMDTPPTNLTTTRHPNHTHPTA
jgi:hypothetical protein